jgi:hypothetical protein
MSLVGLLELFPSCHRFMPLLLVVQGVGVNIAEALLVYLVGRKIARVSPRRAISASKSIVMA